MHEIKFRVWDKTWNLMFHNDILLRSGQELVTFAKIHSTHPAIQNAYGGLLLPTDDPNMVFMQYTGLKDKNGVEIYEGDIVHIVNFLTTAPGTEPYDAVVEWHGVGFHARDISKPVNSFLVGTPFSFNPLTDQAMGFEIIGNIYENPDLIAK